MKNSKVLNIFLVVSGLLLTFIGGAQLFIPVAMKAGSGIDIAGNVDVLNDTRAAMGLVLSLGILTALGAFLPKLKFTSALISPMVFLSMGIGRVLSMLVDGMPVDGLVKATGLEFVLGIAGVVLFLLNREKQ